MNAYIMGGGIFNSCRDSAIRNNHIYENRVIGQMHCFGGGIHSEGLVENNVIEKNEVRSGFWSLGGGIYTLPSVGLA